MIRQIVTSVYQDFCKIKETSNSTNTMSEESNIQKRLSSLTNELDLIENWQVYLQESRLSFNEKLHNEFHNRGNTCLQDFTQYHELGEGTYGKVVAVLNTFTKRCYAMKILNKQRVVKLKQVEHTYSEKRVLQSVSFPFLINLKYFFMDTINLYLVVQLGNRGELYMNLYHKKSFAEEVVRFYGVQVILALEYLHFLNVVYRDLKPENIVVCDNGYIKLTDFGFCKYLRKGRTYSFCGTPEYMAPEIVQNKGYGKGVDWWAVGVLLYEMSVGKTPFKSDSKHEIYKKILKSKVRFPKEMDEQLKHIIVRLIEPDLSRRYGNLQRGVGDIKEHPWFADVDWIKLINQQITPPYLPSLKIPRVKQLKMKKFPTADGEVDDNIFKDF